MFKSSKRVILSLTVAFFWLALGNERKIIPWIVSPFDCNCSTGHSDAKITNTAELLSEINWPGRF